MTLPKLNDVPKYELIIPSTGKSVSFRPFLVKEQKILLMALETQDEKQILNAIVDTIKVCVYDNIVIESLATFDVEYMFLQIRSKSAGETSKVFLRCSECNESTQVSINLGDINIKIDKKSKEIVLTDKYTLIMKYPKYAGILLNVDKQTDGTVTSAIFEMIVMCMDSLRSEDDIINLSDEPRQELENFLDGLNPTQLELIMTFVNTLPKLQHDVKYKCSSCEHNNKITLQGIQDFF